MCKLGSVKEKEYVEWFLRNQPVGPGQLFLTCIPLGHVFDLETLKTKKSFSVFGGI